jgi:hypothetical protein
MHSPAATAAHPRDLGRYLFRLRREDRANDADDHVERAVGVRQLLGVPIVETGDDTLPLRALLGIRDEVARDVDPGRLDPGMRRGITFCPAPQATSSRRCPRAMFQPARISRAPGSI